MAVTNSVGGILSKRLSPFMHFGSLLFFVLALLAFGNLCTKFITLFMSVMDSGNSHHNSNNGD